MCFDSAPLGSALNPLPNILLFFLHLLIRSTFKIRHPHNLSSCGPAFRITNVPQRAFTPGTRTPRVTSGVGELLSW